MNKFLTKDLVYIKKDSIFYQEGKVVGYVSHKGHTTYRVLVGESELLDAEEEELLSEFDIMKIRKESKSA